MLISGHFSLISGMQLLGNPFGIALYNSYEVAKVYVPEEWEAF